MRKITNKQDIRQDNWVQVSIHENCLSKEKVKEAIKRIANNEHPEFSTGFATKLKKELGLE